MSHYKGSGTITQGSQTVAVYAFYDGATSSASDERHGWSGWFSDEDPAQKLEPGNANLELLDGRTGQIRIDGIEAEAPFGGTFTGVGAEP
jgi:hypothetical protein